LLDKPDANSRTQVDLSSFATMAGFNLRMLDVRMMRTVAEQLARIGLSPASATVLQVLESNPDLSLGKLADALLVQRPNMTKLVNRLVAKKLVRRDAALGDKRQVALGLTEPGRKLAIKARGVLRDHDETSLAILKPAERRQFLRLVATMLAGLESKDKPAAV
jgi:DNA-binding MarR family transcriptional regulator